MPMIGDSFSLDTAHGRVTFEAAAGGGYGSIIVENPEAYDFDFRPVLLGEPVLGPSWATICEPGISRLAALRSGFPRLGNSPRIGNVWRQHGTR